GQTPPRVAVSRYRVVAHEARVIGKDTEFAIRGNLPVQVRDHERGALINGEEGRADANLRSHTATLSDSPAKARGRLMWAGRLLSLPPGFPSGAPRQLKDSR